MDQGELVRLLHSEVLREERAIATGETAALAESLQRIAEYLDQLAADPPSDPELRPILEEIHAILDRTEDALRQSIQRSGLHLQALAGALERSKAHVIDRMA